MHKLFIGLRKEVVAYTDGEHNYLYNPITDSYRILSVCRHWGDTGSVDHEINQDFQYLFDVKRRSMRWMRKPQVL